MNKKTFYIVITVFIVLLLIAGKCQSDSLAKLKGEQAVTESQLETANNKLANYESERQKTKDSINEENEKHQKTIDSLKNKNIESAKKVKDLNNKLKKDKEKIKNMSYKAIADTMNVIYKTDKVLATDISVNMGGDIPNKVVSDIAEKNSLTKTVSEKDKQLFNKDIEILKLTKISDNNEKLFQEAEKNLYLEKESSELKDVLNDNLKSQLKKPKVGNILIGVGIGVIGGILIAK